MSVAVYTAPNTRREWLVVDGTNVIYRGYSCTTAVTLIREKQLPLDSLFKSDSTARLIDEESPFALPDTLPETP